MAWIESHQELREHPKTKRLCRALALPRPMVVGYLHFLWWWAYDYAPEGDLSEFTDEDIADALDWEGDPGVLVAALVSSGFINADRHLHDWGDFAQKWIERRRADRERKRAASRKVDAPVRVTSTGVPPEIHSQSGVTGPDRTGPNLTVPNNVPSERSAAEQLLDELGADAPAKTKSRPKSEKTLPPDDFEPNATDYAAGKALGMGPSEVDSKAVACMDFWRGKGEKRPDWHATLRTWLRNAPRFDQPRNGSSHRNGTSRPSPGGIASRIPNDASEFLMGRNGPIPRR